jgi:prepilin-type N-terminal cleavage/methylation domain-containing protein
MRPTIHPREVRGQVRAQRRRKAERAAFTLIELLVVIGILLILLAIAMPAIAPPLEDRRIRETSRGVNAFFAGARDRAISTGRPFGVQIQRFNPKATVHPGATVLQRQLNTCMALHYVEVPPPYSGDSLYSRMVINVNGSGQSVIQFVGEIDPTTGTPGTPDMNWPYMVRPGDRVQLGFQGHLFTVMGPDSDSDGFLDNPVGAILYSETSTWPAGTSTMGIPYQVLRAPVKSAAQPYQLPEGAVIDLSNSGVYGTEFAAGSTEFDPVTIVFGPSGGLTEIYLRPIGQPTVGVYPVTGSVFLLIGEPEKVIPVSGLSNAEDLTNRWVSINARTGLIQSNELAADTATGGAPTTLFDSRRYARDKQGMGGR